MRSRTRPSTTHGSSRRASYAFSSWWLNVTSLDDPFQTIGVRYASGKLIGCRTTNRRMPIGSYAFRRAALPNAATQAAPPRSAATPMIVGHRLAPVRGRSVGCGGGAEGAIVSEA